MAARRTVLAACVVALLAAESAGAEVRCALDPDGTLHVMNVPDPPGSAAPPRIARDGSLAERYGAKAQPYLAEIAAAAERYGLSPELLAAVISVESNFDPRAVSTRGARGLMQLLPSTAHRLGVTDPFDPRQSIDAGARHLHALLRRFPGDLVRALAAYNAGEQAVATHGGTPPFQETRRYVERIWRLLPDAPATAGAPPESMPPRDPERLYRAVTGDGTVVYSNRSNLSLRGPAAPAFAGVEVDVVAASFDASSSPEACRVAAGGLDAISPPGPGRDRP